MLLWLPTTRTQLGSVPACTYYVEFIILSVRLPREGDLGTSFRCGSEFGGEIRFCPPLGHTGDGTLNIIISAYFNTLRRLRFCPVARPPFGSCADYKWTAVRAWPVPR